MNHLSAKQATSFLPSNKRARCAENPTFAPHKRAPPEFETSSLSCAFPSEVRSTGKEAGLKHGRAAAFYHIYITGALTLDPIPLAVLALHR